MLQIYVNGKKLNEEAKMKTTSNDCPFLTPLKPRSSSKPTTPTPTVATVSSSLDRSVYLYNWWLVKPPNGKGLAVGGFASLERLGVRLFGSAAICKRHDATTLETTDGINITISGFINRSRTRQNGYPYEVCNRFQLGFPYNWEEYADGCFGEKSAGESVPTRISASNESNTSLGDSATFPFSLLDLPVTRINDLLYTFGDQEHCSLRKSIYNDMLGKSMGNNPTNNVQSGLNESPVYQKESNIDPKCNGNNTSLDSTDMATEECQKAGYESEMGKNLLNPTMGRSTRSVTRLKNLRMEQEESLSPNTNFKHRSSDWTFSSDATNFVEKDEDEDKNEDKDEEEDKNEEEEEDEDEDEDLCLSSKKPVIRRSRTRERLRGIVRRNVVKVSHPTNFVEEEEEEDGDEDEDDDKDQDFCLSYKKPVIRRSRTRERLKGIVRRNVVKVSHPTNFVEEEEEEERDQEKEGDEDEEFCLSSKKPVIRRSRTRERLRGIVRRNAMKLSCTTDFVEEDEEFCLSSKKRMVRRSRSRERRGIVRRNAVKVNRTPNFVEEDEEFCFSKKPVIRISRSRERRGIVGRNAMKLSCTTDFVEEDEEFCLSSKKRKVRRSRSRERRGIVRRNAVKVSGTPNFVEEDEEFCLSSKKPVIRRSRSRERRGIVRRNAMKLSHTTNFVEEDEEFCLSSKKPVIRRSRSRERRGFVRRNVVKVSRTPEFVEEERPMNQKK